MTDHALSMVSPDSIRGLENLQQLLLNQDTNLAKTGLPKLVTATGQEASLPQPLYDLLIQAIQALASGDSISVISTNQLLTANEAADLLNVSNDYLIKLLEAGEIQTNAQSTDKCVNVQDILHYKASRDRQRQTSMQELTSLLQDEGFYDEHTA